MSEIYSLAAKVIIYLGEATAGSDLAMEYLSLVRIILRRAHQRRELKNLSMSFSHLESATLARAINELLRRPWFNRIWVVQEVCFAQGASVVCGKKEVDWSVLRKVMSGGLCQYHPLALSNEPYVVLTSRRLYTYDNYDIRPITRLTLDARGCLATDPRDKIYALVPFPHFIGQEVGVDPDYTKSTADFFVEFAINSVSEHGFCILTAVQSPAKVKGLPFWVPDWSVPPLRTIMFKRNGL